MYAEGYVLYRPLCFTYVWLFLSLSLFLHLHVYIYIYMQIYNLGCDRLLPTMQSLVFAWNGWISLKCLMMFRKCWTQIKSSGFMVIENHTGMLFMGLMVSLPWIVEELFRAKLDFLKHRSWLHFCNQTWQWKLADVWWIFPLNIM